MRIVLLILGAICLGYYLASVIYGGFEISIIWIWLVGAICFLTLAGIWNNNWLIGIEGNFPIWMKTMIKVLVFLVIGIFVIVEGAVSYGMSQTPQPDLKYMIVLGCQVNGKTPSKALRMRLNSALEYLQTNPGTIAILSGGQGSGEDITEAECMKIYLQNADIEKERLIMEDKSTTTVENLLFSKKYVVNSADSVAVVTNNFHVFRSMKIAQKQGYENVSGIAAPTGSILLPHYMVREGMALVKEWIIGTI